MHWTLHLLEKGWLQYTNWAIEAVLAILKPEARFVAGMIVSPDYLALIVPADVDVDAVYAVLLDRLPRTPVG